MATQAKIVITVAASRGASTIRYSTKGRYVSTAVNVYQRDLTRQPIQPTSSQAVYWLAVLAAVVEDLTANPTPP